MVQISCVVTFVIAILVMFTVAVVIMIVVVDATVIIRDHCTGCAHVRDGDCENGQVHSNCCGRGTFLS